MPTVTVIITTCDRPEMLSEALQSVQAQTLDDIEILICDDASDARTEAVVKAAQASDPRITYKRNTSRLGQQPTFRLGLESVNAEMFAVCHDDDMWEPDFLARMTQPMVEHPDVSVVFCDHWVMDDSGAIDQERSQVNTRRWGREGLREGMHRPFVHLAVVDQAVSPVIAALMRTSAVDRDDFPEEIGPHYDLWLAYLLSRDGLGGWYIPERLTRYRVHSSSATSGGGVAWFRSSVFIWERLLADQRTATHPALRWRLGSARTSLGVRLIREGNSPEARPLLRQAFMQRPSARSGMAWGISLLPPSLAKVAAR